MRLMRQEEEVLLLMVKMVIMLITIELEVLVYHLL
jgi:hypothetical protein